MVGTCNTPTPTLSTSSAFATSSERMVIMPNEIIRLRNAKVNGFFDMVRNTAVASRRDGDGQRNEFTSFCVQVATLGAGVM